MRKGRNRPWNKTMALFLASYIVVMLLPLSIGLLYYYPNMRDLLINHAEERSQYTVNRLSDAMDDQLANVFEMPGYISANRLIIEYEMRTNPLSRRNAQYQLGQMIRTNTFISELFLYLRNMDYLIGARGSAFYYDELSEHASLYQTSFGDISNEALNTLLDTTDRTVVIPSRDVLISGIRYKKMLLFISPVPQARYAYGSVLTCVSADALNALVNVDQRTSNGRVLYYGDTGALLHTSEPFDTAEVLQINQAMGSIDQPSGTLYATIQGSRQLLSWATSLQYGWRYVHVVPVASITSEADHLQKVSILVALLIVWVSAVAIYFAMRVNYLPIRKMARQVADTDPRMTGSKDDFAAISTLIHSLKTSNVNLTGRITQSAKHLRKFLIDQALHGKIRDVDGFLRQSEQLSLPFHRPPFLVMVAVFLETQQGLDAKNKLLAQRSLAGIDVITVEGDRPNHVHLILSSVPPGEGWRDVIASLFEYHLLAVGTIEEKITDICASYRYADAVLDYLELNSLSGWMMAYNELPDRVFKHRGYPTDVMQSLELTIQHGDFQRMDQLIQQVIAILTVEGAPPYFTRSIYFNAENLLIAGLHRWLGSESGIIQEIGTRSMLNHYSIREMVDILRETAEQLSRAMERHIQSSSPMEDITAYMDMNLSSPQLSLQSVADAFGLSPSALSRIFKEKTGRNFKEYIDAARLSLAKKMLEEQTTPVEQIAASVGYDNLTSFYRLFKKHVGIAPGEYRQARRGKKGEV